MTAADMHANWVEGEKAELVDRFMDFLTAEIDGVRVWTLRPFEVVSMVGEFSAALDRITRPLIESNAVLELYEDYAAMIASDDRFNNSRSVG